VKGESIQICLVQRSTEPSTGTLSLLHDVFDLQILATKSWAVSDQSRKFRFPPK
jgi:hypothetical protein